MDNDDRIFAHKHYTHNNVMYEEVDKYNIQDNISNEASESSGDRHMIVFVTS